MVAAEVEDKGEEKMSSILLRSHLKISIWEQQKSSPCHVMLYARGAMGECLYWLIDSVLFFDRLTE